MVPHEQFFLYLYCNPTGLVLYIFKAKTDRVTSFWGSWRIGVNPLTTWFTTPHQRFQIIAWVNSNASFQVTPSHPDPRLLSQPPPHSTPQDPIQAFVAQMVSESACKLAFFFYGLCCLFPVLMKRFYNYWFGNGCLKLITGFLSFGL